MTVYNRIDDLEEMLKYFEEIELLVEIVKGLSSDDARESFDYIRRMHGLKRLDDGTIVPIDCEEV